jgi:hypothetical protein
VGIRRSICDLLAEQTYNAERVRSASHPSVKAPSVVDLLAAFFPRPCDREVVRHFEYSGHGIGTYAGDVLIGLTVYHAVEGYIAILHRDADRLCWVNGIFIECRKSVN